MVVGGGEDRGDAGATRDVRINFGRDPAGPAVPSSPGPLRQWEHGWRGPRTPSARLRARTPPIGLSSVVPDAFICALQGSVSPSEAQRPTASPTHLYTEYRRYRALLTSARAECIILSRTCHVPCLTELVRQHMLQQVWGILCCRQWTSGDGMRFDTFIHQVVFW